MYVVAAWFSEMCILIKKQRLQPSAQASPTTAFLASTALAAADPYCEPG